MSQNALRFVALDHVGLVVSELERSIEWWSTLLGQRPFNVDTRLAAENENYLGRILGYDAVDLRVAFWSLPGGTALEMIEYLNPRVQHVDMETFNVGNAHLCFETEDIDADYARLKGLAEFRSPEAVTSVRGPYKGARICYLRDPDGISIELVQFAAAGRPFQTMSPFVDPYESRGRVR